MLIERGANLNTVDIDKKSALLYATEKGKCVKQLRNDSIYTDTFDTNALDFSILFK